MVALSLKEAGLLSILDAYGGVLSFQQCFDVVEDGRDAIRSSIDALVAKGLIVVESFTNEGRYSGKQIVKSGKSQFPHILTNNKELVSNKGNQENPKNTKPMTETEYKNSLRRFIGKRLRAFSRGRAQKANRSPEEFIESFIDYCYKNGKDFADNKGSVVGLKKLLTVHADILSTKPVAPDHSDFDETTNNIAEYAQERWAREVPEPERSAIREGLVKEIFNPTQAVALIFVGARLSKEFRNFEKLSRENWKDWNRLYPEIKQLWGKMKKKIDLDESKL